jgi:hypothetical protein
MGNVDTGSTAAGMPMFVPVDINQDADMYTFTADLPGVSKADTKVSAFRRHVKLHRCFAVSIVIDASLSSHIVCLQGCTSGSLARQATLVTCHGLKAASEPCRYAAAM